MKMHKDFFNIIENSDTHTEYIKPINDFIVDFFQNIGANFDYQTRLIFTTNRPAPRFCSTIDNPQNQQDLILLSIDNCSYWCKVIYQLSHELTHCYIFCHNKHKSQEINWIEETICEALSLFFLKYFFINWKSIELSKINFGFSKHIATYLDDILKEPWRKAIANIKTQKDLQEFNDNCQDDRAKRRREMICLYKKITKACILGLLAYRDYVIEGTLMLDTQKYRNDFQGNDAVDYICSLQDGIMANIISNAA